jgi:hypothetical protein
VLTVASFLFDITLTLVLYVGLNRQQDTTRQIQQVQQNGAVVRQQVLCPLYHLFLSSYSTKARDAYPQGPAAYDRAFATLRAGNSALGCA